MFDKSITIDNSNLNVIDFIDQSIEIDTHNHRCPFKVLNLSIYQSILSFYKRKLLRFVSPLNLVKYNTGHVTYLFNI